MATQLLLNSGFEGTLSPWATSGTVTLDTFAHTGNNSARLVSPPGVTPSDISQLVFTPIPLGSTLRLSFNAEKTPRPLNSNSDITALVNLVFSPFILIPAITITIPAAQNPFGGTASHEFSYYEGYSRPIALPGAIGALVIIRNGPPAARLKSQLVVDDVFLYLDIL